jgi:hypothetical protein
MTTDLQSITAPIKIRRFQKTVAAQEAKVDYLTARRDEASFLGDWSRFVYYERELVKTKHLLAQLRTIPLFPELMAPIKRKYNRKKKEEAV